MRWLLSLGAVALLLVGCQSRSPAQKTYEVRGLVLAVRADIREVSVAHEDIPGYMAAMSMSFAVKDAALLSGLSRGDLIRATLVVTDTDAWLTSLDKTGRAEVIPETDAEEGASPAAAAPDLLEPGHPVPPASFVDQEGKPFRFSDARGKAVALTFIYTRCPLPTFCPRMDRHFVETQRLIDASADLRGRAMLVTVSFDPAYDTPAVLREHAERLGARPGTWRFVTADPETVDAFATVFGVSVIREGQDAAGIVHNLRTAVVGPDGRVRTILQGGDWTPDQLARELTSALR